MNMNFDYFMDFYNFSDYRNYKSKPEDLMSYLKAEFLKTVVPRLKK